MKFVTLTTHSVTNLVHFSSVIPHGSLCLLESVNNEERSLAIILSEPKKTSGSNDIIQKVATSLSEIFPRGCYNLYKSIHWSKFKYHLSKCFQEIYIMFDNQIYSEREEKTHRSPSRLK